MGAREAGVRGEIRDCQYTKARPGRVGSCGSIRCGRLSVFLLRYRFGVCPVRARDASRCADARPDSAAPRRAPPL